MKAAAVMRIIRSGSIPGSRASRSTTNGKRSCVAGLDGLGHLLLLGRWGDGAGLAHHLDYAGNLLDRHTLGRQSGNELDRGSSRITCTILRWASQTSRSNRGHRLSGRSRWRERIRQRWYIYRLGGLLRRWQERHA
jgi:hypothetical protein